ncbi:MAG: MCE family protein [Chitinispirillaceae bacterium]|nr:MCE family protein [Chitinispirillaceae bacterium]
MSDRNLGFAVIVFLIIFLLVPAAFLSNKIFKTVYQRTVVFEKVSSLSFLRIEDPVKVRGTDAGIVRSISWKGHQTFVVIESDHEIAFYEGYRIFAEDKGLMGDRYVSINPGDAKARPIGKKELLKGIFLMGPTEAVSHISRLEELVDTVAAIIKRLTLGTPSKKPLSATWGELLRAVDSTTYSLSVLLKKTDRELKRRADSISMVIEQTADLAARLHSTVPASVETIETALARVKKILVRADMLVCSSDTLASRFKGANALPLLKEMQQLEHQLEVLRTVLNELQKQGLDLPIRIR